MEPMNNIGRVCDQHAPKLNPEWARLPFKSFVGRIVKLRFAVENHGLPQTPHYEYMWVVVEAVKRLDGKTYLRGRLNNDPLYAIEWSDGDQLLFDREEITEVWNEDTGRPATSPKDHPAWTWSRKG